jgi:signal transduction histidine kinase
MSPAPSMIARVVEAGDAERRRLERDLHDGAQQRLVSLGLQLGLLATQLAPESEASRLLAGARAELAASLKELREIARGLHPAVLSHGGLDAALEALATRAPVPVHIVGAIEERAPEPVEVAAYYVVSESLCNVAKYAHAAAVTVRVAREGRALVVEVADDGIGGADPSRGSGLCGLEARVEALGGHLHVSSPPGRGTRVRAVFPVAGS